MDSDSIRVDSRDTWNQFVVSSPYGHILQSWEWGELKCRTGWEATRLAIVADGQISACAQVLIRTLPYSLGRVAYVPKGPVVDYSNPTAVRRILAALRDLAADEGVISLKIEPEVQEPSVAMLSIMGDGLRPTAPVQMRSTIWVDIAPSEEQILANQKQKTRYNTKLAAKKGVTVQSGTVEDLDQWYAMYEVTARRDRFSIHSLEYYRTVLSTLGPAGFATLLLAHHDGDLLSGIIVFAFGRTGQYMYGASSNEKRNLMAPYLVQWEGMRWAKGRGATTYDLWGIPDKLEETEDLWGVYRHKRGYGGKIVRYIGAFDLVRSPLQYLAIERVARPIFKKAARLSV